MQPTPRQHSTLARTAPATAVAPGGNASEGFYSPQHPPTVHELVKDYCIGPLMD
jgi:hypothetical protein